MPASCAAGKHDDVGRGQNLIERGRLKGCTSELRHVSATRCTPAFMSEENPGKRRSPATRGNESSAARLFRVFPPTA